MAEGQTEESTSVPPRTCQDPVTQPKVTGCPELYPQAAGWCPGSCPHPTHCSLSPTQVSGSPVVLSAPPNLWGPLSRPTSRLPQLKGLQSHFFPGEGAAEAQLWQGAQRAPVLPVAPPSSAFSTLLLPTLPPPAMVPPLSLSTSQGSQGHLGPNPCHPTSNPAFRVLCVLT